MKTEKYEKKNEEGRFRHAGKKRSGSYMSSATENNFSSAIESSFS
jgi:hypothetical protein